MPKISRINQEYRGNKPDNHIFMQSYSKAKQYKKSSLFIHTDNELAFDIKNVKHRSFFFDTRIRIAMVAFEFRTLIYAMPHSKVVSSLT